MHPQGETMDALLQESDNFQNAGDDDLTEVEWEKVDINSSSIRFVFKNQIDSPETYHIAIKQLAKHRCLSYTQSK